MLEHQQTNTCVSDWSRRLSAFTDQWTSSTIALMERERRRPSNYRIHSKLASVEEGKCESRSR